MKFASWGRYPRAENQTVLSSPWRTDRLPQCEHTALPFGLGRSYGDSCLNNGGSLIPTLHLDHFIHFDYTTGLLVVEAGVSLERILSLSVPRGWFLPVVPGTKFVTVGGAIANDIHGKNHHRSGTFGAHVTRFELVRSTGERYVCSPSENPDLYRATIGGLGLTGLITWAEIQMKKIPSSWIEMESLSFQNLDQFMAFSEESDEKFDYNVAWVDCFSRQPHLGRGLYMRGNFSEDPIKKDRYQVHPSSAKLTMPVDAPSSLLNSWTLGTFNALYYHKQFRSKVSKLVHYKRVLRPP